MLQSIDMVWGITIALFLGGYVCDGEFEENTGKDNFQCYKGIFAILVMLHHIAQRVDGQFFKIFLYVGSMSVAAFMLLSGYGIMVSYKKKNNISLKWYLIKVLRLYIPWFICFTIKILDGLIPRQPKWNFTISWFILAMTFLYFSFAVSFNNKLTFLMKIIILTCLCLVWNLGVGYMIAMGKTNIFMSSSLGTWWTWPVLAFPVGVLWGNYKNKINKIISNKKVSMTTMILLIILLNVCIRKSSNQYYNILTDLIFSGICIIGITWSKLSNPVLHWIGKYSMEFFIVHTLYMDIINVEPFAVTGELSYVIVLIILTVITMIPIKFVSDKIIKLVR